MSQQSIATQTQLGAINFELQTLLDNLVAHVNDDMSEAHGFNLVFGIGSQAVYSDASGNLVGSFQLIFTIDGNTVYVPANITILPGQPSTNGVNVNTTIDSQSGASTSTWVTQFQDTVVGLAKAVLEQYLLPHTVTGYWEAHGGIVLVSPELEHQGVAGSGSSAGWWSNASPPVFVADSSLLLTVGGALLRVPCSTLLGGPIQNVVLSGWENANGKTVKSPTKVTFNGGGSNIWDFKIIPVISGGTGPFTYNYQYFSEGAGSTWTNIAPNTPVDIPFDAVAPFPSMEVQWNSTTGFFTFVAGNPPQNDGSTVLIRAIVSNSNSSFTLPFSFFVQSFNGGGGT